MLPAFSAVYHLHPWDIDRMTSAEVDEYIEQLPRRQPGHEGV